MGKTPAATSWDAEYAAGRYIDEQPVGFVEDVVAAVNGAGLAGSEGLYIGCGNGRNYLPLVAAGLDLVGLDIAATAIEQLAMRAPERRHRLVCGDLSDLPPDLTYPVVIGIQVFQHGNREATHAHLRAAQERLALRGLFCMRVNAVGTDVALEHQISERNTDGSLTVQYLSGPKQGLEIHFFSGPELDALFADGFQVVLPLRLHQTWRTEPGQGQWSQWEGIWSRTS